LIFKKSKKSIMLVNLDKNLIKSNLILDIFLWGLFFFDKIQKYYAKSNRFDGVFNKIQIKYDLHYKTLSHS
jgi:hypothetical protein